MRRTINVIAVIMVGCSSATDPARNIEIQTSKSEVQAGGQQGVTVKNLGSVPAQFMACDHSLQRKVAGRWWQVVHHSNCLDIFETIQPGQSTSTTVTIDADVEGGTYRVLFEKLNFEGSGLVDERDRASGEFVVKR